MKNSIAFQGCSAREPDFERPINEIFRMPRTGARFSSKLSGRSARERVFERKNFEISGMLRTAARFYSTFSGCFAREGDVVQCFQDAPQQFSSTFL